MKVYELPITKLTLASRNSVASSLLELLKPCKEVLIHQGSGLFIGNESAQYPPRSALLEGWSRLLWGLVPLHCGGFFWDGEELHRKGLLEGTDPTSDFYWGDVSDYDQRMVEMAAIALALMLTPDSYWVSLLEAQQDRLINWLAQINTHEMPHNNWMFFRVLVNLAFEKLERKEFNPEQMEKDLCELEGMYENDGWYHDKVPFDNYNPLAMQYYALIYYTMRKDKDPKRCNRFANRARLFAQQHIHYFTSTGEFVPYGRSLTYRFAVVSFYSACAFANIEVLPWGVLKGIILRNLRWWFKQPIFDRDGFLTVGYRYPSRTMAEQYNAPGSPYWALKAYLILALKDNHPFWSSKELPLPLLEKNKMLRVPGTIMQRTEDDDVVMLNAGQYPEYHMLQVAEKYAKFSYSAHYTFSSAASYYEFEACGCDSMLYFSDDGFMWRPRREMEVMHGGEDYLCSVWKPYPDVQVTTYLIPSGEFHIRMHEIHAGRKVFTKEGGFAIERYQGMELETKPDLQYKNNSSLQIILPWDVSYIEDPLKKRTASPIQPLPNLSLSAATTIVPVLSSSLVQGTSEVYITCVGAWRNKEKAYPIPPTIDWNATSRVLTIGEKRIPL